MPAEPDSELFEGSKGHWITVRGQAKFIPEGKKPEEVIDAKKASYMTSSQEAPTKIPSKEVPHYVLTADEIRQPDTDLRVGDRVKYHFGTKSGVLVRSEGIISQVSSNENFRIEHILTKDIRKESDYTAYGLWQDIPITFKNWMLKKVKAPQDYANKDWRTVPPELRKLLANSELFVTKGTDDFQDSEALISTARNEQHSNPTMIAPYDGAKETKQKAADEKNENNWTRGTDGKLINPAEDKRRDGRQVYDNEEQNNTFSVGEEDTKEPWSTNITGGSNNKKPDQYGTNLGDWRNATPSQDFSDYDVKWDTMPKKNKIDSGTDAYSGEGQPLSENPKYVGYEEPSSHVTNKVGVPTNPVENNYGPRYMTKAELAKWRKEHSG
ncbi:MAG: hypothetical protein KGI27_13255 [Thaumarchaeota archaeon]|nr:hypothetical protein [Nitrososphaerota archaeon]